MLRRELPLEYACQELGVILNSEGRAHCPFHQDADPSFALRIDDDGVERWHCFPCSFGGDVYDLVMRIERLAFPEALNRVQDIYDGMPPSWTPSVQLESVMDGAEGPEQWSDLLTSARQRAAEHYDAQLSYKLGLASPEEHDDATMRKIDAWLRSQWHIGFDDRLNIVLPHYTEAGALTGIKLRSGDFKWSRRGSKYDELYGSWWPREHKYLILCEGESDAIWAKLQALQDGVPVDVRALPSGAQTFKTRFVEQAREWELVYLAFDADEAGVAATRQWVGELGNDQCLVIRLPYEQDLREARPKLRHALNHAVRPPALPGGVLFVNDHWERVTNQGQRALTSWYADPIARLVPAEIDEGALDPGLEVVVHRGGQREHHVLKSTDMQSISKLRQWTGKRNLDNLMNDGDVPHLNALLQAQAAVLPDVYQTERVGVHAPPAGYEYAGGTLVLPDKYIGRLPWKYVGTAEINTKVKLDDTGQFLWSWLVNALNLNADSVMQPLIAWLCATTRRIEVQNFPILFVGGQSGSGKSTIAQHLCRMFGSEMGAQLGAVTAFPLMKLLASSTTLPVFIDEWSRQSREDTRAAFQGNVPIIYEGGIAERGRADQTVQQYRCTSPVLVAGEDTFNLERERDRIIQLELGREGQSHDALAHIAAAPLERFGYWFNRFVLDETRRGGLPTMPTMQGQTRPEYNREVLEAGWQTLLAFVEHTTQYDASADLRLPSSPDLSALERAHVATENEYEALVTLALEMTDQNGVELAWETEEGTWVRFRQLTSPRILSQVDVQLPGGFAAMKRYFEHRSGSDVEGRRVSAPVAKKTVHASFIPGFNPSRESTS